MSCGLTFAVVLSALSVTFAAAAENQFADRDEQAQNNDVKSDVRLRSSIMIKAKPSLVKASIHEQRTDYRELEYAKILSTDGTITITEQRFSVALLGVAACTFREIDISPTEVDYRLLKSDMFAVMDGRWILTPNKDGRTTRLDLYCHAGVLNPVPRFLLKIGLSRSLKRHLEAIKKSAEEKASKGGVEEPPPAQ